MNQLEQLLSEESVNKAAGKVLEKIKDKITDLITDSFYQEMNSYLYEHYDNFKSNLEAKLIAEISDQFVQNPSNYKYHSLRQTLLEENKEVIIPAITNEIIETGIRDVLLSMSQARHENTFHWRERLYRFIADNINKFRGTPEMDNALEAKIRLLENQIEYYKKELAKYE